MAESRTSLRVDLHTHVFPDKLPALGHRYNDQRWPHLEHDESATARIMLGASTYRQITDHAWRPDRRIEDMDRELVNLQVVSPTPVTFGYWGDPKATLELSRFQNDFIADFVGRHPKRFIGLGTVPLQEPGSAIEEMTRVRKELKLPGLELGATVRGNGFHVPELRPFFRAAVELDCALFIHPLNEPWSVGEREKRANLPGLHQGFGMPGETAFAAATLMLGGVMSEFPGLRVCLAHGGGPLCMVVPRMATIWQNIPAARERVSSSPMEMVRRFWADTLTFDVDSLILLKSRLGCEKLVVGSDYPFDAREKPPGAVLDRAEAAGLLSASEISAIRGTNALRFLNLS
jgi:aminocarboxymuconate-semialdehyde decarboxylase